MDCEIESEQKGQHQNHLEREGEYGYPDGLRTEEGERDSDGSDADKHPVHGRLLVWLIKAKRPKRVRLRAL